MLFHYKGGNGNESVFSRRKRPFQQKEKRSFEIKCRKCLKESKNQKENGGKG